MKPQNDTTDKIQFSPASYILGFIFAIVLTLIAYFIVINRLLAPNMVIWVIMGLALVQLLVQLVFFLHFGRDKKTRWNNAAFYFMLIILVIIIAGSLWIMNNLNYNMMMTPEKMNEYMLKQSSKGF